MATFDASGLAISTQAEIEAEIAAAELAMISESLDVSTASPIGQINDIAARRLRLLEEALEAIVAGMDPDTATGDALIRLCALTGTYREPATSSRLEAVIDLDAGTYAAGDLAVYPTGRPEDRFVNAVEIVTAGGAETVVFEAESTGPIAVNADDLVLVASAGFNSITSSTAATPGNAIETEAALRLRRAEEVAAPGSASINGIRADLTRSVELLEAVTVLENTTDATVDGIPPHGIHVIVYGPAVATSDDDDEVAAAIFASRAAGIATAGSTTRTVYDDEGLGHAVSFTRVSVVTVPVAITLEKTATGYAGDDAVKDAIAALTFTPGLNAAWARAVMAAMGVAGVLRVSAISLNGVSLTDYAISSTQIARHTTATITVTSATGTP